MSIKPSPVSFYVCSAVVSCSHGVCVFSPSSVRGHRLGPSDDELYQRTRVSVMQKEQDGGSMIYSYSPRGFNINGNRVIGPCAVIPPAILQWNVCDFHSAKWLQNADLPFCPLLHVYVFFLTLSIFLSVLVKVGSYKDITTESLALFYMIEPRIGKTNSESGVPCSRSIFALCIICDQHQSAWRHVLHHMCFQKCWFWAQEAEWRGLTLRFSQS